MEEQPAVSFEVPRDEFSKYFGNKSGIAIQYKQSVETNNDRFRLQCNSEIATHFVELGEKYKQWARSVQQNVNQPKDNAIAKRMLADEAERERLVRQKEENKSKLDTLFALEKALFDWAWQVGVKANQNEKKLDNKAEWDFAVTIFDLLDHSSGNRDLTVRFTSALELASGLLVDGKRFSVSSFEKVDAAHDAAKKMLSEVAHAKKIRAPSGRDHTVSFSYGFFGKDSRVSHSREKSAAWVEQKLQSDREAHFTGEKLVLLFALYAGINHIESQLSMELENKLIHALGRNDLVDKHQRHQNRARRLSFKRKAIDPIASELREALKNTLAMPTINGKTVTYGPDAAITEDALDLLIGLGECVSKLETSYRYKKHATHIENTLELMERVYGVIRVAKGDLRDISKLVEGDGVDLPKSVTKLLQDRDPTYLSPQYSRSQAPQRR